MTHDDGPDGPPVPPDGPPVPPDGPPVPPDGPPVPPDAASPPARRPLVERVGMTGIAAILAILFGGVADAAFVSGDPFLGIMAAIGALMTAWVGLLTLLRG